MGNTDAPWSLPFPDLPNQPHGPAQLQDLADSVHAALGRAYPCVSTARPDPTAGMIIFETDTQRFMYSPDGVNWRVFLSTPSTSGVAGTVERTDILTAATNFSVQTQRFYMTGGSVHATFRATRLNSTLASVGDGNITNTQIATVAAGWRPPQGSWGSLIGGGIAGRVGFGFVNELGQIFVGALMAGAGVGDWFTGHEIGWTGTWPCGDG